MNRDELIETIQRLLALSSSSNEHESAAALARANDLMTRHNLSMVDVETQKINSEYVTEDVYKTGRASATEPFICDILEKYFFVRSVSSRNKRERITTLKFFGDKANVEISRYIFKYLERHFRDLADFNFIRAGDRRTYYCGLSNGLKEKLKKERESLNQGTNRNALVCLDKQLVAAFHNTFQNLKTKNCSPLSNARDVYDMGITDGRNININKGITGNSEGRKLLN